MQGYGEAPHFDLPPEIMENFRRFDVDGNNVLDPYEFASVLQELHNFTEPYIPLVTIITDRPQFVVIQLLLLGPVLI